MTQFSFREVFRADWVKVDRSGQETLTHKGGAIIADVVPILHSVRDDVRKLMLVTLGLEDEYANTARHIDAAVEKAAGVEDKPVLKTIRELRHGIALAAVLDERSVDIRTADRAIALRTLFFAAIDYASNLAVDADAVIATAGLDTANELNDAVDAVVVIGTLDENRGADWALLRRLAPRRTIAEAALATVRATPRGTPEIVALIAGIDASGGSLANDASRLEEFVKRFDVALACYSMSVDLQVQCSGNEGLLFRLWNKPWFTAAQSVRRRAASITARRASLGPNDMAY